MISALYIDPAGPYPGLGLDCWDEARDARNFNGSGPIIAHPPCGPWGKLKHFCTKQPAWCGPHAVDLVRKLGGVLEHPLGSSLWSHCGLPKPGEGKDSYGGYTISINQCDFGHPCKKATWLYICGFDTLPGLPSVKIPTHCIASSKRTGSLPECSKLARRVTPQALAEWLIRLVSTCHANR